MRFPPATEPDIDVTEAMVDEGVEAYNSLKDFLKNDMLISSMVQSVYRRMEFKRRSEITRNTDWKPVVDT